MLLLSDSTKPKRARRRWSQCGWGKKALANAQKFKGQFDKLAKELGVNLSGSEADKLISEYFMLAEDGQGDIDDALAILNTIK